jgi:hypothetical protein
MTRGPAVVQLVSAAAVATWRRIGSPGSKPLSSRPPIRRAMPCFLWADGSGSRLQLQLTPLMGGPSPCRSCALRPAEKLRAVHTLLASAVIVLRLVPVQKGGCDRADTASPDIRSQPRRWRFFPRTSNRYTGPGARRIARSRPVGWPSFSTEPPSGWRLSLRRHF